MGYVAALVCVLIVVVRSQNGTFESDTDEQFVTAATGDTPSSAFIPAPTIEARSLADAVICKIDESLHEGVMYNGSLYNCTQFRGCLMNDDRRLEAQKTMLECIDDRDGQIHLCLFEWYVHWRNCIGFNCYGVALDCEYEKENVGSSPTVYSEQQTHAIGLMLIMGIAAVMIPVISAIALCYFYHRRHTGTIDFLERQRNFTTRMAVNRSSIDLSTLCTVSANDSTFVVH